VFGTYERVFGTRGQVFGTRGRVFGTHPLAIRFGYCRRSAIAPLR
jgi:hypothetical protein